MAPRHRVGYHARAKATPAGAKDDDVMRVLRHAIAAGLISLSGAPTGAEESSPEQAGQKRARNCAP